MKLGVYIKAGNSTMVIHGICFELALPPIFYNYSKRSYGNMKLWT
jgi:hypothetical protein